MIILCSSSEAARGSSTSTTPTLDIKMTSMAFQRKYKIGDVLEYCQEYLARINDSMKVIKPLAIRASLLMTLSFKMSCISKSYEFSIYIMEFIFLTFAKLVQPTVQELKLKSEVKNEQEVEHEIGEGGESYEEAMARLELPSAPSIDDIAAKEIHNYTTEQIELLTAHLINSFLNITML